MLERGARMTGVDTLGAFVRHAAEAEKNPSASGYRRASATDYPFEDAAFDFATAFMSLTDIPETDRVLAEVFRVLRPGGFFRFSMERPCFAAPRDKALRGGRDRAYGREARRHFQKAGGETRVRIFSAAPPEPHGPSACPASPALRANG